MENPASVTPRSGTKSSSIRQSSENENVSVPTRTASVTFRIGSRNQRRMMRAENVPISIWTTRTVTVTTKPVSAAAAPTIAVRTVLAVDGEYCHRDGVPMCSSATETPTPRIPPSAAPITGMSQRPSNRLSRRRKRLAQVISLASFRAASPTFPTADGPQEHVPAHGRCFAGTRGRRSPGRPPRAQPATLLAPPAGARPGSTRTARGDRSGWRHTRPCRRAARNRPRPATPVCARLAGPPTRRPGTYERAYAAEPRSSSSELDDLEPLEFLSLPQRQTPSPPPGRDQMAGIAAARGRTGDVQMSYPSVGLEPGRRAGLRGAPRGHRLRTRRGET